MAQQAINVGIVPNDNTGDPIRSAFEKINANFTEAYATGIIDGSLRIGELGNNNTITTIDTDTDIIIKSNGIGAVVFDTDTTRITTQKTPVDLVNGVPGDVAGDINWDLNNIYICVNSFGGATPAWKRASLV